MSFPITARPFKPLATTRRGWRRHLRDAYERCGHTQDSLAAVLGWAQHQVARLLNRDSGRVLNLDQLEALRDDRATRDVWLMLLKLHALEGGVVLIDAPVAAPSKTGSDGA